MARNRMSTALNGICPYFTMFPLGFPLGVLSRQASPTQVVLDPFVGRGTTLYAARLLGMHAFGIDSNPVATAISEAKLANTTPSRVMMAAKRILQEVESPKSIPDDNFWRLAFDSMVLRFLCRLREGLIVDCRSSARKVLRAVLLGALHGPRTKSDPSYFSNQCTRTYSPKPHYATQFWKEHGFFPPNVNSMELIKRRAFSFLNEEQTKGVGKVVKADSRLASSFKIVKEAVSWIITSPPYYGLRTYLSDQWLRLWFLGGPSHVDYSSSGQVSHHSQDEFAADLRKVWINCAMVAQPGCRLIVRFGAINDRNVTPFKLIKDSLAETPWRIQTTKNAGSASEGKRQAEHFNRTKSSPIAEFDVWTTLET